MRAVAIALVALLAVSGGVGACKGQGGGGGGAGVSTAAGGEGARGGRSGRRPGQGAGRGSSPMASGGVSGSSSVAPGELALLRGHLTLSATQKQRLAAMDSLVKGWPGTRPALSAALGLLRADEENRGAYALSLARLGRALISALHQMVARAPLHLPTLRAAGALAYHLVVRDGLTRRTDGELAALRMELAPTVRYLWKVFLSDTRPDYEIYQGLAAGGEDTVKRLVPPVPAGGLTRVAMVLYLILTSRPNEALLPARDRSRLRKLARPLAMPFAKALSVARSDGTGESPDSLMLGLSVLGGAGARAVAALPAMAGKGACPTVVKLAHNLLEQSPPAEVEPLRALLRGCARQDWASSPAVLGALRKLMLRLGSHSSRSRP